MEALIYPGSLAMSDIKAYMLDLGLAAKKAAAEIRRAKTEQKNNLEHDFKPDIDKWTRVEMIKSGIVNGVRFPKGIQVDVTKSDSERLISSGKASIVA